ncbi:hypothetical protein [Streptomyces sp. NPDC093111]|uniref:hypothetical protein n=1 Tax=Streptomyces sp. NPDC093111 TaxID=3154978 RepID=UPI003420C9A4
MAQSFEEAGILFLQPGVTQGQDLDLVGVRGRSVLELADLEGVFSAQVPLCLLQPGYFGPQLLWFRAAGLWRFQDLLRSWGSDHQGWVGRGVRRPR